MFNSMEIYMNFNFFLTNTDPERLLYIFFLITYLHKYQNSTRFISIGLQLMLNVFTYEKNMFFCICNQHCYSRVLFYFNANK